jgi:hypothetical protein
VKAPTLVPISPFTIELPPLLNAPTAVNSVKLPDVPRLGACPKAIIGNKKKTRDLNAGCICVFKMSIFQCEKIYDVQKWGI